MAVQIAGSGRLEKHSSQELERETELVHVEFRLFAVRRTRGIAHVGEDLSRHSLCSGSFLGIREGLNRCSCCSNTEQAEMYEWTGDKFTCRPVQCEEKRSRMHRLVC